MSNAPPSYDQSQAADSAPQFTYSNNFQTNFNSDFGKAAPPGGNYPVQPQPGNYPVQPQPGNYPVQPQGSYPVGPQGHANPVIVTSQAPQNGNPVIISRLPGHVDPGVRKKRCVMAITFTVLMLIIVVVTNVVVRL